MSDSLLPLGYRRAAEDAAEKDVLSRLIRDRVAGFFHGTVRADAAKRLAVQGLVEVWAGTGQDRGMVLVRRIRPANSSSHDDGPDVA